MRKNKNMRAGLHHPMVNKAMTQKNNGLSHQLPSALENEAILSMVSQTIDNLLCVNYALTKKGGLQGRHFGWLSTQVVPCNWKKCKWRSILWCQDLKLFCFQILVIQRFLHPPHYMIFPLLPLHWRNILQQERMKFLTYLGTSCCLGSFCDFLVLLLGL